MTQKILIQNCKFCISTCGFYFFQIFLILPFKIKLILQSFSPPSHNYLHSNKSKEKIKIIMLIYI